MNNIIKEIVVYGEDTEIIFIALDSESFINPVKNEVIDNVQLDKILKGYADFGFTILTIAEEQSVKEVEFDDLDDLIQQSICIIATSEENGIFSISLTKSNGHWYRECNKQKIYNIKTYINNLEKSGFILGFYDKDWQIV